MGCTDRRSAAGRCSTKYPDSAVPARCRARIERTSVFALRISVRVRAGPIGGGQPCWRG